MATINHAWYAANSVRRYPIDETASCLTDDGTSIPNGIIVDCAIVAPKTIGESIFVGGITVTDSIATVVLLASNVVVNSAFAPPIVEEVSPVAAISILKQNLVLHKNYALSPLVDGVGGWLAFGEAAEHRFVGRFASARQSALYARCVHLYDEFPVKSLRKATGLAELTGIVNLAAGNDIAIRSDNVLVDGVLRKVGIIELNKIATDDNIFAKYIGPCGKRPESGSCDRTAVQFLGGAKPDCSGNIDVTFEFATVYPFPNNSGGLAVSIPTGVADICAGVTTLPDSEGNLPGVGQGGVFLPPPPPVPPAPSIDVSIQSDSLPCIELPMYVNFTEPDVLSRLLIAYGAFELLDVDTAPLLTEPSRSMPPLYDGAPEPSLALPGTLASLRLDTRNVAVFESCDTLAGDFRVGCDFYIAPSSGSSPQNAGMILNYNPDNEYYVYVYFDVDSQGLKYCLCAPGGCSIPITALPVDYPQSLVDIGSISWLELWYRMEVQFSGSAPLQPYVRMLQLNPSAPDLDVITQLDLRPWALFVPRGWFGMSATRSVARFTNFWMEYT